MSRQNPQETETQHAFLVAWGAFAQEIGLVQALEAVPLHQKTYTHRPQTKVLEFLVAQLSGIQYLQEISLAAHPLDKDQAVAAAWGQPAWADYTGLSRSLSGLSWEEAHHLVAALETVSRPFIQQEVAALRSQGDRLRLDGDLTGLSVSSQATSYPNAVFGYMDAEIRLGYQAAVVSLESPQYGRLWLSVAHHPGDTASSSQAENLVRAAEARLGLRPRRRTEQLQDRIRSLEATGQPARERQAIQQAAVASAEQRLLDSQAEVRQRQAVLQALEQRNQASARPELPNSRLAQARKRLLAAEQRQAGRRASLQQAQTRLENTQQRLAGHQDEVDLLRQRLVGFEAENAANPDTPEMEFRLDAGFGTYENLALLIELGYEVCTKPYNAKVVDYLRRQTDADTQWIRVSANAEMTAWPALQLAGCPYPLDIALQRFQTGQKQRYSAFFHFGPTLLTADLPAWLADYNGRQTIEAGIKESKQVFYLHRLKVRSEPAIFLQEACVQFAANFIRWASHWLATRAQPLENGLRVEQLGLKRQVRVGTQVSASVIHQADGLLLKFSPQSAFAGKVLAIQSAEQFGKDPARSDRPKFLHFLGRFLRFSP